MAINTIYAPVNVNSLEAAKLKRNDDAVSGMAAYGTSTNFDLKVTTDDHLLLGGELIVEGAAQGDYVRFQVVDVENVIGYGAGVMLDEFVRKRFVASEKYTAMISSRFPAKLKAGLYLRVIYTSVGSTDVFVAINYDISKVLV